MAHRVVPFLAQQSVAIGGGADRDDRAAMDDGDVNDPEPVLSEARNPALQQYLGIDGRAPVPP